MKERAWQRESTEEAGDTNTNVPVFTVNGNELNVPDKCQSELKKKISCI